jgi:fructose/tagatose bisphosphate aldolase
VEVGFAVEVEVGFAVEVEVGFAVEVEVGVAVEVEVEVEIVENIDTAAQVLEDICFFHLDLFLVHDFYSDLYQP